MIGVNVYVDNTDVNLFFLDATFAGFVYQINPAQHFMNVGNGMKSSRQP